MNAYSKKVDCVCAMLWYNVRSWRGCKSSDRNICTYLYNASCHHLTKGKRWCLQYICKCSLRTPSEKSVGVRVQGKVVINLTKWTQLVSESVNVPRGWKSFINSRTEWLLTHCCPGYFTVRSALQMCLKLSRPYNKCPQMCECNMRTCWICSKR